MSSALDSSPSLGVNPRQLGLMRRQSYDLLATSKASLSQALSLGNLPSPTFSHIPAGQRSVPAVEMNRMLGHDRAFRSISGPLGDGQRTPGGSLVVGAEIFGFGGTKSKDRWTSKSITSEDSDGESAGPRSAASHLDSAPAGWPSEIEEAVASSTGNKGHHSVDFSLSGLTRPAIKSSGSSIDLRSSAFANASNDVHGRSSSRPSAMRAKSGLPSFEASRPATLGSSALDSSSPADPAVTDPAPGGPPDMFASAFAHVIEPRNASTSLNGLRNNGQSEPAQRSYSKPTDSVSQYSDFAPTLHPPQHSPEDVSLGLQNISLSPDAPSGNVESGGAVPDGGPHSNSLARDGPPPPSRQSSGGFTPYFPPYLMHQDSYPPSNFGDPTGFFTGAIAGDPLAGRRDSGYAPSSPSSAPATAAAAASRQQYGLHSFHPVAPPPPWAVHNDFTQSNLSNISNRQGGFAFAPTGAGMPYGPASAGAGTAGGPFAASPMLAHTMPVPGMNGLGGAVDGLATVFQPSQVGQQHQIILGRGLRSSAEYIAPGPSALAPPSHTYPAYGGGYGHGYGAAETMGRALRSATLEEFRTSRHRVWELSDIAGHIVEFSGDQLGSRHIQTKLETASAEEKAMVFGELLPNMLQLSTDVFANYVVQKFFEQANQLQKTAMANVLEGHVLQLSLQMYGCRVVQKALEYVLVDQQVRLIKELDGHVLKCARDAQSNHVIQRAIERVPSDKIKFITDACLGQVYSLATHPYGCRVLQRIFENCPPSQTRDLLDELHRYTQTLIQDQYGNYVVQWVIEKGAASDRSLVVQNVVGQVLALAQQKFASNVVEKCVLHGSDEERNQVIEEVLGVAPDGSSVIKAMLVHPYANYVMQKILHIARYPQRERVYAETALQLAHLRKYSTSYSKHLITIEKLLAAERARGASF